METMAGRQPRAVDASLRPLSIAFALLIWSVCCAEVSARALPEPDGGSSNMTELQMHVSFFDRNKDGILTPLETFQGFVAIGCEIAFSAAAASTIHTALAPFTNPPGALPPYVNIYVEYIHKAIHGSDTGAYDSKGRFVQEKFDEIFTKHAHIRKDALSLLEVEEMLTFNRDPLDPASWAAAEAEWQLIYQLATTLLGFLPRNAPGASTTGTSLFSLRNAAGDLFTATHDLSLIWQLQQLVCFIYHN